MSEFCPKCGTEKGRFIEGFCQFCYLEDHKVVEVPKEFVVQQCKKCDKLLVGTLTKTYSLDLIKELILNQVKFKEFKGTIEKIEIVDSKEPEVKLFLKGKVGSSKVELELSAPYKLQKMTCRTCQLSQSGYYQAIIQIRNKEVENNKNVDLAQQKMEDHLKTLSQKEAVFYSIEKLKLGFDVKLNSKNLGKKVAAYLAHEFNSDVKYSSTLIGVEQSGKGKKRYTFMVRV